MYRILLDSGENIWISKDEANSVIKQIGDKRPLITIPSQTRAVKNFDIKEVGIPGYLKAFEGKEMLLLNGDPIVVLSENEYIRFNSEDPIDMIGDVKALKLRCTTMELNAPLTNLKLN